VTDIEAAFERLPAAEQDKLARRLGNHLSQGESPEMLADLDEGIRSLEEKAALEHTRAELEKKMRRWAGVSS
jgi:hypothetical protein